jgi:hypothetical protein
MTDKWKLVPIEPTEQMIDAYLKTGLAQTFYHDAYKAMLNAAPSPEQASQEPVYQIKVSEHIWEDVEAENVNEIAKHVEVRTLYTSPPNLQAKLDKANAEIARLRKALETCTFKKDIGDYGGEYWYDENLVTKALAQGEQNE